MRECNKNVKYEEKVLPQMKNAFANEGNFQCGGREGGGHWSASYKPSLPSTTTIPYHSTFF